jgi:hypothetical protein
MKTTLCSISGCRSPFLARGWCEAHYRRWRRHGHPLGGRHYRTNCRVTGCPNPHSKKGLCAMHYERWRRHGDPQVTTTDIDDIAVERAVQGERPDRRFTVAEREAVVRILQRSGLHDGEIAEHLDIGTSGVWNIRQRLGLPANAEPVSGFSGRCAA